jgi:hypothetical protein
VRRAFWFALRDGWLWSTWSTRNCAPRRFCRPVGRGLVISTRNRPGWESGPRFRGWRWQAEAPPRYFLRRPNRCELGGCWPVRPGMIVAETCCRGQANVRETPPPQYRIARTPRGARGRVRHAGATRDHPRSKKYSGILLNVRPVKRNSISDGHFAGNEDSPRAFADQFRSRPGPVGSGSRGRLPAASRRPPQPQAIRFRGGPGIRMAARRLDIDTRRDA